MNAQNLAKLLEAAIPAKLPILITGAPGIGKSDIVNQAAAALKAQAIISHPAVSDPTDFKGLPWPDASKGAANFLPFGEFNKALTATSLTVWFLDDLGQAPPAVQAAAMQLLLARRVNGHVLPDCVSFVAATNRRTDRAGVAGILEPVKSRFAAIVELQADVDSWSRWAVNHGIAPTLIAFLRFRPELLSKFVASADMTNSPSPRTWTRLSALEGLHLPGAIESEAFAGAVGEGAAVEYLAFRKLAAALVSIDAILLDPAKAAIPSKPAELFAVSTALAARATDKNLGRVATYATRMLQDGKGEFAALTLRDATRRNPALASTDDFITKIACSDLGKLISGQE